MSVADNEAMPGTGARPGHVAASIQGGDRWRQASFAVSL